MRRSASADQFGAVDEAIEVESDRSEPLAPILSLDSDHESEDVDDDDKRLIDNDDSSSSSSDDEANEPAGFSHDDAQM